MSTSPAPSRPPLQGSSWRPGRNALWWVLAAAAFGLGLFFWVAREQQHRFFRGEVPPVASTPDYAPLPAPEAAEGGSGSGMDSPPAAAPRSRTRPADRPRAAPRPGSEAPGAGVARVTAPPRPIASASPPPRYPAQALRRGESGTVLLRVAVGADGVPTEVAVANGSGSRLLDRAAVDAVRRWRFTPATANGEPVADTVQVPIEFRADR
ncbi:MAG TPA: TonB family protein [Lysobacter sp.]|nr:TonB family protein [Lysobacter sp.]